jgi:hypothetical protein
VPREVQAEIQGKRLLFCLIDVYEVAGAAGVRGQINTVRQTSSSRSPACCARAGGPQVKSAIEKS